MRLKKTFAVFGISSFILILIIGLFFQTEDKVSIIEFKKNKTEAGPDQRPTDWAWERRTYPYFKADPIAYRAEIAKAKQMKNEAVSRGLQQVEFAGPTNIGGRISDIEFNPANPDIVYAGAATGGVFKSEDMGETWFPVFDDQANLNIGDIGIDPSNPDIIYVGTGEANGGHNNFPGGGVYKSTDAGNSWDFVGLENTVSVGRVVVDPSNGDRVFVAAVGSYFTPNPERGIFRSEDGGANWEQVLFVSDSTGAIDLIIDPENPSRMIAAMWERVRRPSGSHLYGPSSGMYKSIDGGDSWELIESSVLPDPTDENIGRIGLALCESQPDVVYSLFTDGSYYRGLFRSNDFGENWTNADPAMGISSGTSSFSWYFGQVRVHPNDPDIVFALDVSYMRSVNGGSSWPINYGYGVAPNNFHVDQHALAFHPTNPDYIIVGNDGGMDISTDGGEDFTGVAELPINQFYEIGLDANNPDALYGGTQDNGTIRTLDGGLNNWTTIYGGDGFYVIVDYEDNDIIYAESQNGNLGKSTDGGYYFYGATYGINESEPKNWSTPVIMDPEDHEILYYGTNRVYRTIDGADYWYAISPDLTNGYTGVRPGTVSTIGVSPVNTEVIWAGTSDGNIWVSVNNGEDWTEVSSTLPNRWVSRVIADPMDAATAYATFTGLKWADPEPHVFRTTDYGANWEDISGNLPDAPVNAFAVDTENNNYLFVGTDLGAYYSSDLGASWEYIDEALPLVTIYDMKIHPEEHFLVIGTHARSMYKLDLNEIVGTEEPISLSQNKIKISNAPNPFTEQTQIYFSLEETTNVSLKIFDLKGALVTTLYNGSMTAGAQHISWNGRGNNGKKLPLGTYVCELVAGNQQSSIKVNLQ